MWGYSLVFNKYHMSHVWIKVYIHTYIYIRIFFISGKLCFVVVILHLCVSLSQHITHTSTSGSPSCPTSVPTVKSSRKLTWKPGRLNYTSYMKSSKISQACKKHYQLHTWTCRRYMMGAIHQWLLDYAQLSWKTDQKAKTAKTPMAWNTVITNVHDLTSKVREANTNIH